jgi:cysteine desulfuration protein SufE
MSLPAIDDILDAFDLIDDWEERYRYVIELGRSLDPLPAEDHVEAYKVRGCASQVWLKTATARSADGEPVLTFRGDSDAHIVKGLMVILLAYYSGRTAEAILESDALELFARLGLTAHLTPQRSNGVRSMVERIKRDAQSALAAA